MPCFVKKGGATTKFTQRGLLKKGGPSNRNMERGGGMVLSDGGGDQGEGGGHFEGGGDNKFSRLHHPGGSKVTTQYKMNCQEK